jgi:hypothetical protein
MSTEVPIKREGTEYTLLPTEIVENRETFTRSSLQGESEVIGRGRKAAFSAEKRAALV